MTKDIMSNGEVTDWRVWNVKFLAYAHEERYKNILLGQVKVPIAGDMIDAGAVKGYTRNKKGQREPALITEKDSPEKQFAKEANY